MKSELLDMMGRTVSLASTPKRIISLVPSQTEFLIDIGAPVVGRTKFCIHPESKVSEIPVIGGTKNFRFDKIAELDPDLIIGNKEENYQHGIEDLAKKYPVWMSDIITIEDSFEMMSSLGSICDLESASAKVISRCKAALESIKASKSGKVVYLIWKNPWMAAGRGTFIDEMLQHLGYENLITKERYPELSDQDLLELNPEKILFSSEPFPFKEKHLADSRNLWSNSTCQLVDGELFSWYGSRMQHWS